MTVGKKKRSKEKDQVQCFYTLRPSCRNEAIIGLLKLAGKVNNDLLDIAIVGHSAAERINYIESLKVIRGDIDRKLLEYVCLSFDKKKRRVIGLTKIHEAMSTMKVIRLKLHEQINFAAMGLAVRSQSSITVPSFFRIETMKLNRRKEISSINNISSYLNT
jgi:hypothetical protein